MTVPLYVLLVNNSENEASSIIKELEEAGYAVKFQRVDSAEKLTAALKKQTWDIILADTTIPDFNGLQILRTSRKNAPEIPVVFITENLSWDNTGSLMEAGATSCISKTELKRLMPVIKKELKNAELNKEFKAAEQQIILQSKLASESPDPILRVSREGILQYHNKAGLPLLLHWQTALGKPLPVKWQRLIKEVYESGNNSTTEIEYKDQIFLLNIVPVQDADYVNIYAVDISGLKNAEEKLKNSEAFLNDIIDQTPNALCISDNKGNIIRMNQALRDLMQLTDEQVIGKYNVFKDEQVREQGLLPLVESVFKECKLVNCTIDYHTEKELQLSETTKATHRLIDITVSPVKDHRGRILNVICMIKDITEQELAKAALRESEEKYRSLIENMAGAVLLTIPNGEILSANPAAESMFGCSGAEICRVGRNGIIDVTDPRLADALKRRDVTGKFEGELTFIRKDGSKFPGEITSIVFTDSQGNKRTSMIIRDISERKLIEEKLLQSESRHRTLFETMAQGVVYQDAAGMITSANPAAERILGLTLDQMLGRTSVDPHWRAIREDGSDFPGETHPAMVALKTGQPVSNVVMGVFHPQDEMYHWILINAVPQFHRGEKQPYQVYTTFEDITERKKTEEKLTESENRLRELFDNIETCVAVYEPVENGDNFIIKDFNKAAEKVEKVKKQDIIGKLITDVFPGVKDFGIFAALQRVWQTGKPERLPVSFYKDRRITGWRENYIYKLPSGTIVASYEDVTERKQAEQALKESESKYHNLVERANDSICIIQDGRIVYANQSLAQIWGGSMEELTGKEFLDFVHPDSCETVQNNYKLRMAGKEIPSIYEVFMRDKSGKKLTVELNAGIITYQEKPANMVIIRDITARKEAEQKLADSERTLRAAQSLGKIGSWDTDVVTGQITWSDELYEIFERDKTLGPPSTEEMDSFYSPEDNATLKEAIQLALETSQVFRIDLTANLPNGKTVFQHIAVSPVNDENGKTYKFLGVIQDITERKLAEEQIAFQAQLLDNATELIHVTDYDGNFLYVNKAGYKTGGFSPEVLYEAKLPPAELNYLRAKKEELLQKGEITYESVLYPKNGGNVPVEIRASAIKINGRDYILSACRDITKRKMSEEQVRLQAQLLDNSIDAVFVHDLENRVIYVNEAVVQLYGYSRDELLNRNISMLVAAEKLESVPANLQRVITEGKHSFETLHQYRNGTVVPVEIHSRTVEWGGKTLILTVIRDITERKRALQQLQDNEQRLKEAQTLGKIANYEVDGVTHKGIWSEEMFELFERDNKLPAPDLEEIKMYFTPEEFEKYDNITRQAIDENRKAEGDVVARLPSGRTPVFHVSCRCIRNEKGKVAKTFGTIQDITERKKAEEDLQKSYTRLSKILDGVISAMAATIEIRDPYTSGHQQQVAKLASAIAEELGLAETTINAIYTAGVIHDIGKIGIPADILSKPGKLTNIEFALIKAHSQIGSDVLKNIDFPFPIAKWVLEHHERLDGSGYPAGLKDGEISHEAKILAVADVVESMISHRPYRPGLGIDAALEEVNKNKGKLYDAEAVAACIKLFKKKGFHF